MSKLALWLSATRPKTLPAALSPVIIGLVLAYEKTILHIPIAIITLICACLIQIGTNLANDYFDAIQGKDTDERLGPKRLTQSGLIKPSLMKNAFIFVLGIAFILGLYLSYFGGLPILIIGIFSIIFAVLYTAGPYPLAYNGLGDIFVLLFFGPIAVGGTYFLQTSEIEPFVLILGLCPGLISLALLTVNNIRDYNEDKKNNKNTIVVKLGIKFAQKQYLFALLFSIFTPYYIYSRYGVKEWTWLTFILLPFIFYLYKKILTVTGREFNKVLEKTGLLLVLFTILFCISWLLP